MPKTYYVYIMSNYSRTLYVGITNNVTRRVHEHKTGVADGFTKRYRIHHLVFVEETSDVQAAIAYEKRIKGWSRDKKIRLIEAVNPGWRDLGQELI